MEKRNVSITIKDGMLVINFINLTYRGDAYLVELIKRQHEVEVTYIKRNWVNIDHDYEGHFSDVDPYSVDQINKALPEYVEIIEGHWEPKFFGLAKKWVPPVKRLKAGWVELKPSLPQTVTASSYRIVDKISIEC